MIACPVKGKTTASNNPFSWKEDALKTFLIFFKINLLCFGIRKAELFIL